MIESMTGFAAKTVSIPLTGDNRVQLSITLKSLNSRFFEAHCKLPYQLSHLETRCIKLFKKQLHRGNIYFTIVVTNPGALKSNVVPALETARAYVKAINTLKEHLTLDQSISLERIIALPHIFCVEETAVNETFTQKIVDAITELIESVTSERRREGETIAQDLQQRINAMQSGIEIIARESEKQVEAHKERLNKLSQETTEGTDDIAEARKGILYTMLDKIDVHEEISRFKSHLENLTHHITSETIEKGRLLDFTLQELAREINTITAKCSDATIGAHAITIKVEIEKAREQVQNVV